MDRWRKKFNVTQEQFDILMEAASKLDKQGKRSVGKDGRCLYRGPNGTECFVGHMIDDDDYDRRFETPCTSEALPKGVVKGFCEGDRELLGSLQMYHDKPWRWEEALGTNPNAMQDYVKERVKVV